MPRGWLLVLCVVLFGWQPLTFAGEVSESLPTIAMRGAPGAVELLAHGSVAALSIAAGWALWIANPLGPFLAFPALIGAAAAGVQSLYWSALPHDVVPGEELPRAAAIVIVSCAWLLYLHRSRRIRSLLS